MRLIVGLLLLGLVSSVSRGDDPDRARKVKVSLALGCPEGGCEVAPKAKPEAKAKAKVGALDWFVSATPAIEVAPPPKVAKEKKTTPAPAPTQPAPQRQLWQMWDAQGRTWYEWRDQAPSVMPPPLDWQVSRPPVVSPFPACVSPV